MMTPRHPPAPENPRKGKRGFMDWLFGRTPPPPSNDGLAALTMASTVQRVMSAWRAWSVGMGGSLHEAASWPCLRRAGWHDRSVTRTGPDCGLRFRSRGGTRCPQ